MTSSRAVGDLAPASSMVMETLARLIDAVRNSDAKAVVIEPLSEEDGGGFLATVPDLPGCMSDGDTREEAARNVGAAIVCWLEEAEALGRTIPEPRPALRIA